jgi:hypothetical protein
MVDDGLWWMVTGYEVLEAKISTKMLEFYERMENYRLVTVEVLFRS